MTDEQPTLDPDATVGTNYEHLRADGGQPPIGRLGEFEIVRELGRGGMGVVYEAYQPSLDRRVALKVLPPVFGMNPQATARFEREARAAAKLHHRNIVSVHAIGEDRGQHFYAMELVDGVSLDHVLDDLADGRWNDSLDGTLTGERSGVKRSLVEAQFRSGGRAWADTVSSLIAEAAEALDYAHSQGVVHRDIKPANLMLSRQGHVCITDFGLARLTQEPGMTMSGALVGTPAYMSPEQVAAGRMPLDHRTDIYSLGAVLYEMLTLQRPFAGTSREEVIGGVLTKDPAQPRRLKPAIPQDVETICLKALEKDPDRRYQTAAEMAGDLREYLRGGMIDARPLGPLRRGVRSVRRHPTAATVAVVLAVVVLAVALDFDRVRRSWDAEGAPQINRLAVLPFRDASEEPGQEFWADGITEVLIADLGSIGLPVVAQRSVNHYKNTEKSIREIAEELEVDAIVEGTVLRSAERIRVTATLIDAVTEKTMWGDRYERSPKDILMLQGEVAQAIANRIRVELTPEKRALLTATRVVNPEAQEAYMIGKALVGKWRPDAVAKGIRYLERALEHDPDYAPAYAGLATAYVFSAAPGGGWQSGAEVADKARHAAERALDLDESSAEAHTALGAVSMFFDWDFERAEREFRRAIELNPSLADARVNYTAFLVGAAGRPGEALEQISLAIQVDPLYPWYRAHVARAHYMAGDYEAAHAEYDQMLDLDPDPFFQAFVNWARSDVEVAEGRLERAVASLVRAVELSPVRHADILASLGQVYGMTGRQDEARAILRELDALASQRYVSRWDFARIHAGMGETDQAFAELERAYEDRCGYLYQLGTVKYFEGLRADPRWDDLVRRVGTPETPEA